MINLFDEKNRIDLDPSLHNENAFSYYDRSARSDVSKVRNLLNVWFKKYPDDEKAELKSRFKKTFSSAFYELFLYELFRQQDFEITIHPEIQNSSKRPDFLLKKNEYEIYIEAKEAKDKTEAEEALENRTNQLYDLINKIDSPNFLLNIEELILKSEKQPSTKKVKVKVLDELNRQDLDLVAKQLTENGYENRNKITYDDEDLYLIISLIPKVPSSRIVGEGRSIGMYPMETFWGGAEESIKSSFMKKAKRYGTLEKPYIICINAMGKLGNDDFDVANALWGSLAYTWSTDPNNKDGKWERQRDGIFLDTKGPRYKNVSGVLVTKVMEFNLHVAPHWFAKHPFSENEAKFDQFKLTHSFVKDGQIQTEKKCSIREILNIEETWLDN